MDDGVRFRTSARLWVFFRAEANAAIRRRHLLTSLLSFNIGVELGQLLVLAVMIPALELLFRYVVAERMGTIIFSALVAHTGGTG